MKIKILLVEDNMLFRKGIASLLAALPDFEVVGELESGREAASTLCRIQADLVLLDVKSPGGDGLEAIKQIRDRHMQVKVVLLTHLQTRDYVRAVLQLNVNGYVLKSASPDELWLALRSVARGRTYLSPDISNEVIDRFLHPEKQPHKGPQIDRLTVRERGVIQLVAEGKTTLEVAKALCVSTQTIKKDRASLMRKLSLHNATDLTMVAMQMGLTDFPEWVYQAVGSMC
jgi:DNA-binding NarL/FixJ family response regulator